MHYWYDVTVDMPCNKFFSAFLMYNDGDLTGFGWAINAELTSPRYEHPTADIAGVKKFIIILNNVELTSPRYEQPTVDIAGVSKIHNNLIIPHDQDRL